MTIRTFVSLVCFVLIQMWALPARAELVFFSSGRNLSVKAHRMEGESLVLELRGGGEIVCAPAIVARIEPDEVPYPEPAPPVMARPMNEVAAAEQAPRPFADLIDRAAAAQGVDVRLVRAVIQVESAYQPRARSPKGAMGLMQLMPATARQYSVVDPYDPRANVEAGIRHLKSLLDRFPTALALAAYNAGEAAVTRFGGVPPFRETRDYVSRILQLAQ
jgi:soluble lytic murein transglycosylase-like protein